MSYTQIFEKVKEERNEGVIRPNGGTAGNTPSRPINSQHDQSTNQTSSKVVYLLIYKCLITNTTTLSIVRICVLM